MENSKINILLPTDFSDNAWNTVVYALKFYAEQKCNFYFLHATKINTLTKVVSTSKFSGNINDVAITELKALKELAKTSNANNHHHYETILSSESIKEAVETCILKHNIDIVIMGTKGNTGAKELLFGSNTVNLIKKMRLRPILIIPDDYDFVIPSQIAFPTDFNRYFNFIALNPLINLALIHSSKIRIIHINKEQELSRNQEHNLETLKDFLKNLDHSFHWMPDYTNMADEIDTFIEELDIELLVMVKYKHSFIENLINEPVIEKIGFKPRIPFLVIPN